MHQRLLALMAALSMILVAELHRISSRLTIRDIHEEVAERGHLHTTRVLKVEAEKASADLARSLGLRTGARIFHTLLVHLENGVPIQYEDRYVNPAAAPDYLKTDFSQTEAEGMLDGTRAVIDLEPEELNAAITGKSRTTSLWAEQILQVTPELTVSLSARHNRTKVTTVDTGRLLGLTTTLDAEDTYSKLNPGLGATFKLGGGTTAYAGYNQGNRAPSPIELGCSDPANPCVLPNALQADPPLESPN